MIVNFHPKAEQELLHAVIYNEDKAMGLGYELLYEFESALALIKAYPEVGVPFANSARRMLLIDSRMGIIYNFNGEQIKVFGLIFPEFLKSGE